MSCLFCRIAAGEIPASKVYEDADLLAFNDINPQAPLHVLIIPKRHIATTNDLTEADEALVGKLVAGRGGHRRGEGLRGPRVSDRLQLQRRGGPDGVPHPSAPAGRTAPGVAAGLENCRLQIADCRLRIAPISGGARRASARGLADLAGSRSAPGPAPGGQPHARPRPARTRTPSAARRVRVSRDGACASSARAWSSPSSPCPYERLGRLVVAHVRAQRLAVRRRHVGRVGHDQIEGARGVVEQRRLHERHAVGDAEALARSRARPPAPAGEMSVAVTRAAGSSCARVMARQPLPVPTSAIAHARRRVAQPRQRRLDDELGLGPGNEHRRRDEELEVPELTVSGDVGHRLAPLAPRDQRLVGVPRRPAPAARHVASDRSRDPTPGVPRQHFGVDGRLIGRDARADEPLARGDDRCHRDTESSATETQRARRRSGHTPQRHERLDISEHRTAPESTREHPVLPYCSLSCSAV